MPISCTGSNSLNCTPLPCKLSSLDKEELSFRQPWPSVSQTASPRPFVIHCRLTRRLQEILLLVFCCCAWFPHATSCSLFCRWLWRYLLGRVPVPLRLVAGNRSSQSLASATIKKTYYCLPWVSGFICISITEIFGQFHMTCHNTSVIVI